MTVHNLSPDEFRAKVAWAVEILGQDPDRLVALAEEVAGVEPEAPEVEVEEVPEVEVEAPEVPADSDDASDEAGDASEDDEDHEGAPEVPVDVTDAQGAADEAEEASEGIDWKAVKVDEAEEVVKTATDADLEAAQEDARKGIREAATAELERRDAERA